MACLFSGTKSRENTRGNRHASSNGVGRVKLNVRLKSKPFNPISVPLILLLTFSGWIYFIPESRPIPMAFCVGICNTLSVYVNCEWTRFSDIGKITVGEINVHLLDHGSRVTRLQYYPPDCHILLTLMDILWSAFIVSFNSIIIQRAWAQPKMGTTQHGQIIFQD